MRPGPRGRFTVARDFGSAAVCVRADGGIVLFFFNQQLLRHALPGIQESPAYVNALRRDKNPSAREHGS